MSLFSVLQILTLLIYVISFSCVVKAFDSRIPPVINIAPLIDPSNYTAIEIFQVQQQISTACQIWGFFHIINHGISDELQLKLTEQTTMFFASSKDVKDTMKRSQNNSRGFADNEFTKRKMDAKEVFDVGQSPYNDLSAAATINQDLEKFNRWPDVLVYPELQHFQSVVETYYEACLQLSKILTNAMANAIPCANSTYFSNAFSQHTSLLRLNYYPVIGKNDVASHNKCSVSSLSNNSSNSYECNTYNQNDQIVPEIATASLSTSTIDSDGGDTTARLGVSRHSDAGGLTVLLQYANQPGLEVYTGTKQDHGDGEWVPVAPVKGALTINTGDMIQVLILLLLYFVVFLKVILTIIVCYMFIWLYLIMFK